MIRQNYHPLEGEKLPNDKKFYMSDLILDNHYSVIPS
jgi:hypothetical protein